MKLFELTCDLFMVPKSDEKRDKSELFFTFFVDWVSEVQKNMPKVEAKKPAAKSKGGAALKKAGQSAMMAELMAK